MLDPDLKEIIQVATPVLSALVGISAVVVAVRLGILQRRIQEGQRRIQEAQLKNALYDRRFAVYDASEKFLVLIMQKNGAIETFDLQGFVGEVEKGELLFGPEVAAYLKELQTKAGEVYVKSCDAKHKDTLRPFGGTDDHLAVTEMMRDFCGPMLERRKALFRPYLKLEG
jgi:hypothetical protein